MRSDNCDHKFESEDDSLAKLYYCADLEFEMYANSLK